MKNGCYETNTLAQIRGCSVISNSALITFKGTVYQGPDRWHNLAFIDILLA